MATTRAIIWLATPTLSRFRFFRYGAFTSGVVATPLLWAEHARLPSMDFLGLIEVLTEGLGDHECPARLDVDSDNAIGVSDLIRIVGYTFCNEDPPSEPSPNCGPRPEQDTLPCFQFECEPEDFSDAPTDQLDVGGSVNPASLNPDD